MSIAEVAAAVIALRETTHQELARLAAGLDEARAAAGEAREAIDAVLDRRLAHSAQAFRDVQKRLEELAEGRHEAVLRVLVEAVDRLSALADAAEGTADAEELRERLRSVAGPRDALRRVLEDSGVVRMDPVGQVYDPLLHEVVRREQRGDCTLEVVMEELRPGYLRAGSDHAFVRALVVTSAPGGGGHG